ncbi:MAG TPA: lactonase family protein [Xanthobacteraceae bacterium]|nr:lactonase family protein [Xanthobacteraceae bacterium]
MATVVYIACAGPAEIHRFALDEERGALEPLDVVALPGRDGPSPSNLPMAFAPTGTTLYAALRSPPFPVTAFAVDPASGMLTARGTAPLPAAMAYIAVGTDGRTLLGASYVNGLVAVSAIASDGVRAPPTQVVATPPKAHCIIRGRGDDVVYATTVDGNSILVFRQDAATGKLTPAQPDRIVCRAGAGPRHLALHPRLAVLYCINETGGSLAGFAIDQAGALQELQYETLMPAGFAGNARAADLHVTPDGRFAYASVRATNVIGVFRIDPASGQLTRVASIKVEGSPRAFAIDSSGRFLICAGQTENVVAVYAIDRDDGTLTRTQRISTPANPSWVETRRLQKKP